MALITDARRHAEDQLLEADARQQLLLGEQPIVGGRVELEDRLQMRRRRRQSRTSTLSPAARWRDGMRRWVSNWRTSETGGSAISRRGARRAGGAPSASRAGRRESCRRAASGRRRSDCWFGSCTHSSASARQCRMCSALKMPTRYEMRVSRSASSDAIGIALHLVERPVADAAEQRPGVLVAHASSAP